MNRQFIIESTADGSSTIFVPALNEHYHSINGAVQESLHVFINAGLRHVSKSEISILEIGFGTGLNAFLTLQEANLLNKRVAYSGIELHPLPLNIIQQLNYIENSPSADKELYYKLHQSEWEKQIEITPAFLLLKIQSDLNQVTIPSDTTYDLIYFDAFAPDKQSEMWTQPIFDLLYKHTAPQGILTTYCAKGSVRRMLQQAGYIVERLAGPPGKREMLRAIKP